MVKSKAIPSHDPRRQADAVVRAFQFQFVETAIAWLELPVSSALLVEVIEDFDTQSEDGETTVTQVTHSSVGRVLTLVSDKSKAALTNFWSASGEGSNASVSMVLHTNMSDGKEVHYSFPNDVSGIEYWAAVQQGADAEPLRAALTIILKDSALGEWLASDPSEADLRARLINRVTWRMNQEAGGEQKALLTALVSSRLASLGLPSAFASTATNLILQRILEIASEPDIDLRRLSALDLNAFLVDAARPGQPGHEMHWELASWTASLDSIPFPRFCADRGALVDAISDQLAVGSPAWLHGASGTGKSTLARQVAAGIGGPWLLVDFRDQDNPNEVIFRLNRAYTDVTLTEGMVGIIFDDISTDIFSQNLWRFAMFAAWLGRKGGRLIFTSAHAPSPALTAQLAAQQTEVTYLEKLDVENMVRQAGAPLDMLEAWALLVHTATSRGHPQLAAAKIASLEYRSWPTSALAEDIAGRPSDALRLTRVEARRRLLSEVSGDQRALLARLAAILLKFNRPMAIAAASVDPTIENPASSLDYLVGPWIERVPGHEEFYRLSPLLNGLSEDLSASTIKAIQGKAVEAIVLGGSISSEVLETAFWNALLGEQGWFFMKLFKHISESSEAKSKAIASHLGTIVYIRGDQPPMPSDPASSFFIRLIQLDVVAVFNDATKFQEIAEAALREAEMGDSQELVESTRLMALFKILFALGGCLTWSLRLRWISELEAIAKRNPLLMAHADRPVEENLKSEFGETANLYGFLLAIGLQSLRDPEDLCAFFDALEELDFSARQKHLDQFRAYSMGYDLYIQSAWANAWAQGELNPESAIDRYSYLEDKTRAWGEESLADECLIAKSILLDEFLKDQNAALSIVDDALAKRPGNRSLLRQKARVLGHVGDYSAARELLAELKPDLVGKSIVDQLYTLREQAVAAARLGYMQEARALFLEAAETGADPEAFSTIRFHKIALRTEAAICAWRVGEPAVCLRELAAVVVDTSSVDPASCNTALMLHVNVRWIVGWLDRETNTPRGLPPPQLDPGAMSALETDVTEDDLADRGSFEDVKVLLSIVALRCGIEQLFDDIVWSETTPGFQLFLKAAEYDLAVETGLSDKIAVAVLNVTAAFRQLVGKSAGETVDPNSLPISRGGGLSNDDFSTPAVKGAAEQLLAVAVYLLRDKVSDTTELLGAIISECGAVLGGQNSELIALLDAVRNGERGDDRSPAVQVLQTIAGDESSTPTPRELLVLQLALISCAAVGGVGSRTARMILKGIADAWAQVLDNQRFLLAQPSLVAPQIESAIDGVRAHRPGALRELLDCAAFGLKTEIPHQWHAIISQLDGV